MFISQSIFLHFVKTFGQLPVNIFISWSTFSSFFKTIGQFPFIFSSSVETDNFVSFSGVRARRNLNTGLKDPTATKGKRRTAQAKITEECEKALGAVEQVWNFENHWEGKGRKRVGVIDKQGPRHASTARGDSLEMRTRNAGLGRVHRGVAH